MNERIWIGLSRILEIILFIMGVWNLYRQNWLWVFGCFFGFSLAMIPIIIKRNFKFSVHWLIELLLVFAISLHIWGGTLNLYSIPYYDTIAHFIASLIIAFFALIVVYILDVFSPRVHMDIIMLTFFIIIFTIAMGALWEIAEFVYDYAVYSGEPSAQVSLDNTMGDLIADTIAGIIVGIAGTLAIRRGELKEVFTQMSGETKKLHRTYLDARKKALESLNKDVEIEKVDKKILPIVNKINSMSDFFTTSSCAGRIAVLETPKFGDKKNAKFLGKWHRKIDIDELYEAIETSEQGELWFLVQSPIFHIATISMENAELMLQTAIQSGFKHSSIKTTRGKVMVEILTTERIDAPIGKNGKLYSEKNYLVLLTDIANNMVEKMNEKLIRLEQNLENVISK